MTQWGLTSVNWTCSSAVSGVFLSRQWIKRASSVASWHCRCRRTNDTCRCWSAAICHAVSGVRHTEQSVTIQFIQQLVDSITHILQLMSQISWFLIGQLLWLTVHCVYSTHATSAILVYHLGHQVTMYAWLKCTMTKTATSQKLLNVLLQNFQQLSK